MKNSKQVWLLLLGIVIGIGGQYLGGLITSLFPVYIQRLDPAVYVLYTSTGLMISVLCAMYFVLKNKKSIVIGIILGNLLWWPFLLIGMAISGTWL